MLNGRSVDLDGALKWSHGRTFVASGEKYQQNLAIRTEDTGHVSKFNFVLKHCFSLETFILKFIRSFLCTVRNCNILHLQDVVSRFLWQNGVYAGHCFIIHLPEGGQC